MGEALLKTLVATLWYMDGHHQTETTKFLNPCRYNVPEASQHQKQKLQNLSESILCEFSNSFYMLAECLLGREWLAKFKIWYKHLNYKKWKGGLTQVGISQLQLHYQTM